MNQVKTTHHCRAGEELGSATDVVVRRLCHGGLQRWVIGGVVVDWWCVIGGLVVGEWVGSGLGVGKW